MLVKIVTKKQNTSIFCSLLHYYAYKVRTYKNTVIEVFLFFVFLQHQLGFRAISADNEKQGVVRLKYWEAMLNSTQVSA